MRRQQFIEVRVWFAFVFAVAFGTAPCVNGDPEPQGTVWIPGGEFAMGAAMNGSGSSEMPPMQRGANFNLDAVKAEMAQKMAQAEAASKGTGQ